MGDFNARGANEIVVGDATLTVADIVRVVRHLAAAEVHTQVRVVVSHMRNRCHDVHKGYRFVVVLEVEILDDAAARESHIGRDLAPVGQHCQMGVDIRLCESGVMVLRLRLAIGQRIKFGGVHGGSFPV